MAVRHRSKIINFDRLNFCRTIALWAAMLLTQSLIAGTYYVDGSSGDDSRDGTAPATAWKSLERVNRMVFKPGDRILFKAGTSYTGQLKPQGSGKLGEQPNTIVVGKFGEGALPRIDGEGRVLDTVLLDSLSDWELADLEVTNQGTNREPWRSGVHLLAEGGVSTRIRLRGLFVHDVNGDLQKTQEGCGIYFESRTGGRFDDLIIENCHVVRTDRNGICQRSRGGPRSTGVIIRGNLLEDIGGDCIKLWGSNGGLVEHNVVRGGSQRCTDAAAGIWPFASDNSVIQFNEVSGMKGTIDSQGFDSDYQCRNSLFQYNYSHDNEGGFILICSPGNSYCENTVIRYNISQNDGSARTAIFHFGGGSSGTLVYNNVIYTGPGRELPLLSFTEWSGGNARDTRFFNNIFYNDGATGYRWGRSTNNVFESNVYYGLHNGRPEDSRANTNRPPLMKPGSGGNGIDTLAGYQLLPGTRTGAGTVVTNNGGRDFFGKLLPQNRPAEIGISEPTSDK